MSLERVPEAFLVDVRDFLRVLALEPWQQETSIGTDHEDSAFELRTFSVEGSLSYLRRERADLEELERSVAEIGALLTSEQSGEADFRSEPWGELRNRARNALLLVPPLDSFSIPATPVNTDPIAFGGDGTSFRNEILGTYEIFTHQLFEVRCESVVVGRVGDEITMPVFGYDLVHLGKWLIGDSEVLRREGPTLDAAGPRYWFDEAAPLTFERTEDSLSIRLAIEEADWMLS